MKNNNNNVTVYTKEEGSLKSRLTNVGTIISLASIVAIILLQTGVIDVEVSEIIKTVVYLVCGAGVLLGVLNNPKGSGIYLPGVDYPLWGKPSEIDISKLLGDKTIEAIKEIQATDVAKESEKMKDKLGMK